MIGRGLYASRGYQALKFEPHLHTVHSDGRDSVASMFAACRAADYAAVALTDHNTVTGLPEGAAAARELELIFVPGVEVTTFHGHAIVLGVTRVPEWRDLEQRGIDALASDVRTAGGLLSVAHPASAGSPVCSGCAWEWPLHPCSVNLLEIFSAPRPLTRVPLELWRQLLAGGGRVAPVAAGDVHSRSAAAAERTATYIYARERTTEAVLEALVNLRVTTGSHAPLAMWLEGPGGEVALMGERVLEGAWKPCASEPAEFREVQLASGGRCVYAQVCDSQGALQAVSAPIWIDTSQ
jgi:hypothetical protein